MTLELLWALGLFAFANSITPGPNNLMLMASGANFGFLRTLPHMAGISCGFVVMFVLVGVGLVRIFDAFPVVYSVLKVCSVIYLLFLAWKIATSAPPDPAREKGRPMTFLQAALFQWVNPKGWAMSLTAISVFVPDTTLRALALTAAVFVVVNLPSVTIWTVMGQQMARVLTNPGRLRIFNCIMAALLIASLIPVLMPPG